LRAGLAYSLCALAVASVHLVRAQSGSLTVPKTIEAGSTFSIQSSGTGKAVLYIIGPEQVLRRDVQLGEATNFPAGSLYNAGHYMAVLSGGSSDPIQFDVVPAGQPANLSFLARPSRLPVGLHGGITGAVYVFDAYRNLMVAPMQVSFDLQNPSSPPQQRILTTLDGAAWTAMDSSPRQGTDRFTVSAEGVSTERVISQVPGDPCALKMNMKKSGQRVELQTDPVRDCSGNSVLDGTIITFTETYDGNESTVDVPLKRGIAKVEMPFHSGATITIASGIALGNQIRLER
jgi:hypothetical protein